MNSRATFVLIFAAAIAIAAVVWHENRQGSLREQQLLEGRLITRDLSTVQAAVIHSGPMETRLERDGTTWRLTSPIQDSADPGVTEQLLSALRDLKPVQTIRLGEGEARRVDFTDLGLSDPKTRVELRWETGEKTRLTFGREGSYERTVYCRVDDSSSAHIVPVASRDLLATAPDGFRDRRFLEVAPEDVERIVIEREDGQIVLERDAGGWRLTKPVREPASGATVEALLRGLSRARISAFADPGAASPGADQHVRLSLQIFTSGNAPAFEAAVLAVPPEDPPAEGLAAVRIAPRGLRVWLPESLVSALNFPPAVLRDRVLANIDLDVVDRIVLATVRQQTALRRSPAGGWIVEDPEGDHQGVGVPADPTLIEGLVHLLADPEGVEPASHDTGASQMYGFDPPALRIVFSSLLSENTPDTNAGEHPVASVEFGALREQPETSDASGDDQPAAAVFARSVPDGPVLVVPAARYNAIGVTPTFWEDRRMFPFDASAIGEISIIPAQGFPASWQRQNEEWHQRAGARAMPSDMVEALAVTLTTLRLPEASGQRKPIHPPERPADFLIKFSVQNEGRRPVAEALDVWIYQDGVLGRHDTADGPVYCGFSPMQQAVFSRAVSAAGF